MSTTPTAYIEEVLPAPLPAQPAVSTFGGVQLLRPEVVRVRLPMVNVYLLVTSV